MNIKQEYTDLAQGFIDLYADRNALFQNIDSMVRLEWDFPPGMPDWVMKSVSTDPRDTITTVVRTFATIRPKFKVMPMLNNQANRDRANQIETAISYNFKQAGRRMDSSIEWAAMRSAAKYANVAAQVVYLPYQEKILKAMGKETKRVKAARRFGDFAFIFHNPANVYPEWSEYGLEGVLTVRVQTCDEFMDTWGELASKLVTEEDYIKGKVTFVTSFDYTNYEKRCVWGILSETDRVQCAGNGVMILEEENKLGFIPYVVTRWGDDLSSATDERVEPLLQSVWKSGQWDALNVLDSLDVSLTVKRAAQPAYAAETPPGTDIEIDATEPVSVAKLPVGTRNFTPLPSQQVDQRLSMQKGQYTGKIWQSTVNRTLNSLEFPSGTPQSSVNQLLSQATNSIAPYKMLGEKTLSELAHLMLCWIHYYGKEYGKVDLWGQYEDKTNLGQEIRIPSDTIDPDELQIEATLTADIPVNRLQQINGAILLYNNFRVPQEELIEELVGGDPEELAKRRNLEDYEKTYVQADLQRIAMAPQLEAQQMQMQQQQEMQSQAMQQEQQARMQEQAQADASNNASPAQDQMSGLGMNPAAGGMPPVNMSNGQR